ncbi:hypothetical protein [Kribbella deserti]|uniref:Antirestriction protein ArdA n=1 Tax=Kribbella deserti TaxID=1926257 RepID=A0ABV6QY69_9ACTN
MGIYLVSVGGSEWFGQDEDGWGETASALNAELVRRGLPPYESVPEEPGFVRGSGQSFKEKLSPSMAGFDALCQAHLSREEYELFAGWSVLVPVSLEEEIWLPVETAYADETVVAGAPQVLAIAERLAAILDLPPEAPMMCDNLDLTMWFLDGAAKELAAGRSGLWTTDLDTAFYVAVYLRAAQHSLRRGVPIVLT